LQAVFNQTFFIKSWDDNREMHRKMDPGLQSRVHHYCTNMFVRTKTCKIFAIATNEASA
jgi:hypothetical protein